MPVPQQPVDDLVGLTVDQIMSKRGIGKSTAYKLHTRANRPPDVEVPKGQRILILSVLDRGGPAGSVADLQARLNGHGYHDDAHSLTHVLWAMQKRQLVRFRERKNRTFQETSSNLTAIRITDQGLKYLQNNRASKPEPILAEYDEADEQAWGEAPPRDALDAALREEDPFFQSNHALAIGNGVVHDPVADERDAFPHLHSLMQRAERVALIREAVTLLERAGEESVAIDLLDRYSLNPEEEEMVTVLKTVWANGSH